jgi:glycerol-3-phosphate cytidylyltransferase-like family protein
MSRRDITRVIQTYIKKAEGLADSSSGDFLKVIDEWRQRVVLVLVEAGEVNPITDDIIKQRIDQINEQFRQKLEPVLSDNQRRLFIKGIQLVDKALEAGNIRTAMPYLSEQKLQRLNQYGAEHIKGLADYARSKIAQEIDLAVLGQKPQQQVIETIGRKLDSASVFGTIAKRAEVILKTEVNRINQMATADRLKQVSIQVQDLKKRWIHSHIGIPRPGHLMLHLVTIDVKEKFELLGADGKIYYVDGPYDPILPASEIVECKCKVIPVVMRFEPVSAAG